MFRGPQVAWTPILVDPNSRGSQTWRFWHLKTACQAVGELLRSAVFRLPGAGLSISPLPPIGQRGRTTPLIAHLTLSFIDSAGMLGCLKFGESLNFGPELPAC